MEKEAFAYVAGTLDVVAKKFEEQAPVQREQQEML